MDYTACILLICDFVFVNSMYKCTFSQMQTYVNYIFILCPSWTATAWV